MKAWTNPKAMSGVKTVSLDGDVLVLAKSDSETRVEFSSVEKITSDRGSGLAFFHHDGEMVAFTFVDEDQRDDYFAQLEKHGFKTSEARQTPMKAAGCAGCGALLVAAFTGIFYMASKDLAEGGEVTIRGRHQFLKRTVAWIIDVVGPTGVLVLGGILLVLLIVSAVKSAKNPPIEITLKLGE